jgi:hypothetical protein
MLGGINLKGNRKETEAYLKSIIPRVQLATLFKSHAGSYGFTGEKLAYHACERSRRD